VLDEQGRSQPMLPILTAISAGSVVLLTYFGFSFWLEARRLQHKRELVLRLRTAIARKRSRARLLHLYELESMPSSAHHVTKKL
jgi:hypothetical protein